MQGSFLIKCCKPHASMLLMSNSRMGSEVIPEREKVLLLHLPLNCYHTVLVALRRAVNGGDELFCLRSFIHSFIHTFNHHIFTSTICETKIHKTWMLPWKTPNFENNQISDYETLNYCSFLSVTFSVSVFQIRSYLVTDFKLLVHSGSLLLAFFFSFDVHANRWI